MMEYLALLLELFGRFFCVGLFSIGGGLATLPFLRDIGQTTGWFSGVDISNMVAISESTPGPMGINMATYVGYLTAGIPGAIVAPLGEVAPALIVIVIVSKILNKFKDSRHVQNAFYGLRAASLGLVAAAFYTVAKLALFNSELFASGTNFFASFNYKAIAVAAIVFVGSKLIKKIHPIVWILVAAVFGIVLKM